MERKIGEIIPFEIESLQNYISKEFHIQTPRKSLSRY
jgi:hypothetical protein